jgi:fumarate reductase iron-sulfur subunit
MQDINSVPLIVRREIEALIAAPLIKAFIEKFGREPAVEVTQEVIKTWAEQAGKALQMLASGNSTEDLQKVWSVFSQAGAFETPQDRHLGPKLSANSAT